MQSLEENTVVFKGTREGISIFLDAKTPFEQLKEDVRSKAQRARGFFSAGHTPIFFKGRELSAAERTELLLVILDEADLEISRRSAPVKPEQVQLPRPLRPLAFSKKIPGSAREQSAVFHQGALRSGQSIRTAGHVVVMGDVNPGAEIISQGNIIVLGSLKGLVHAGCTGDCAAYIAALQLLPTQLRIADIITAFPEETKVKGKKARQTPSYAYIQNGQIYVSPLMG